MLTVEWPTDQSELCEWSPRTYFQYLYFGFIEHGPVSVLRGDPACLHGEQSMWNTTLFLNPPSSGSMSLSCPGCLHSEAQATIPMLKVTQEGEEIQVTEMRALGSFLLACRGNTCNFSASFVFKIPTVCEEGTDCCNETSEGKLTECTGESCFLMICEDCAEFNHFVCDRCNEEYNGTCSGCSQENTCTECGASSCKTCEENDPDIPGCWECRDMICYDCGTRCTRCLSLFCAGCQEEGLGVIESSGTCSGCNEQSSD